MRNLCYFCHFHSGGKKEKLIKILGTLLTVVALFIWSSATQLSKAIEEENGILAQFLPEPGYLIVSAQTTEMLEQKNIEPAAQIQPAEETSSANNGKDQLEQERQAQELKRWKNDRLREVKDLIREIDKVKKQLVRLKGAADEVNNLEAIKSGVTDFASKAKAIADDDELRDLLENTEFGEWWDEVNRLRTSVELPRDINNIRKDQKRAQSTLKQKWICKTVDCDKFLPIIKNMNEQLDKATQLYKDGELEDARLAIQETFHEKGWFGDALGALQMMRDFLQPLRSVRDKTIKDEITSLFEPALASLYEGEVREAREMVEAIQRELGPAVFRAIMNAQKQKRDIPESVLQKIEQLRQKIDQAGEDSSPKPESPSENSPG